MIFIPLRSRWIISHKTNLKWIRLRSTNSKSGMSTLPLFSIALHTSTLCFYYSTKYIYIITKQFFEAKGGTNSLLVISLKQNNNKNSPRIVVSAKKIYSTTVLFYYLYSFEERERKTWKSGCVKTKFKKVCIFNSLRQTWLYFFC